MNEKLSLLVSWGLNGLRHQLTALSDLNPAGSHFTVCFLFIPGGLSTVCFQIKAKWWKEIYLMFCCVFMSRNCGDASLYQRPFCTVAPQLGVNSLHLLESEVRCHYWIFTSFLKLCNMFISSFSLLLTPSEALNFTVDWLNEHRCQVHGWHML